MAEEKSIVIGCDDTVLLQAVMSALKQTGLFSPQVITASRMSDMVGVMRSLDPDLVLLCFRNNQLALNDIDTFVDKGHVPVLCLSRQQMSGQLRWSERLMVFTCIYECLEEEGGLCQRMHSIFKLRSSDGRQLPLRLQADHVVQQGPGIENGRDMSRYILELDQKVDVLMKVKDRIVNLYPVADDPVRRELVSIVNAIKSSAGDHKLWEDFRLYFEKADPGFLYLLSKKHPELTPRDLKYCCYLKMNMSNDDIRSLLGINQESVRTHKYRLKKKMSLHKDQDLQSYLRTISSSKQVYLS